MSRAAIIRQVMETQREVVRELVDGTLNELLGVDLTMTQMKALTILLHQTNCGVGMLSERLGVGPPTASRIVDRLVRAGLARRSRDESDGRRVVVENTAEGVELISRVRHGSETVLRIWLDQLSDEELEAVARGSRVLAAVARRVPIQPDVLRDRRRDSGRAVAAGPIAQH